MNNYRALLIGIGSCVCVSVSVPATATVVTFGLGADDYGALTIGGTPVCGYDNESAAGGCNGTYNMNPGVWYSISIDYKNRVGSDGLSLAWDKAGPANLAYGSPANSLAPNLVPLANLRALGPSGYVTGLNGAYYALDGTFLEATIGEGPIDAVNNIYNNAVSANNWAGFGYFSQFEERLTGEIMLSPAATPLPAALPLFATGLGVMGLFAKCRKRKISKITGS